MMQKQKELKLSYVDISKNMVSDDGIMYERDFARWFYRNTGKHLDEFDVDSCMYLLSRIDKEPFDLDEDLNIDNFEISTVEINDKSEFNDKRLFAINKLSEIASEISMKQDEIDNISMQLYDLFNEVKKLRELFKEDK